MLLYVAAAVLTVYVYLKYIRKSPQEYEILSEYYGDKCWTRDEEVIDTAIKPFKIEIKDSQLDDLNRRLDSVRLPTPSFQDVKFNYGVHSDFMERFIEYWRNSYSWREQEKKLNEVPQFKTKIEGLDIHFLHVKPKTMNTNNQPRPLMLLHGWPGSFVEFYKIIPMLTDPTSHGGNETDLFEVIIPSIPGFGFSQAPEVKGFGGIHCSRIFHKLMLRLGHKKYYLQAGDWGSVIATHMSMLYPSAVKGFHFNMSITTPTFFDWAKMLIGSFCPSLFYAKEDVKKMFPLKKVWSAVLYEMGYFHLQATKPDTVGYALTDSPVGLAAYLVEKFSAATIVDANEVEDGGIYDHWTNDELLTDVMIYWWSGNITSSMRLYKEGFKEIFITQSVKVRIPTGYAHFPNELGPVTKDIMKNKCSRLLSYTDMKEGGHFAAYQVPQLLVEDIRHFIRLIERAQVNEKTDESELNREFKQTHLDRFEIK